MVACRAAQLNELHPSPVCCSVVCIVLSPGCTVLLVLDVVTPSHHALLHVLHVLLLANARMASSSAALLACKPGLLMR